MLTTRRSVLKAGALGIGLAATPGLSFAARPRQTYWSSTAPRPGRPTVRPR
ncbi:hypothetical protein ACIBL3_05630 [Kribbella sp. NPDC050124]|uniref:hypothetical protein n=1 Tax=Kribbella sp. NPDC050124 TaxID=3364114 RepID=UPI0037A4D718